LRGLGVADGTALDQSDRSSIIDHLVPRDGSLLVSSRFHRIQLQTHRGGADARAILTTHINQRPPIGHGVGSRAPHEQQCVWYLMQNALAGLRIVMYRDSQRAKKRPIVGEFRSTMWRIPVAWVHGHSTCMCLQPEHDSLGKGVESHHACG